MTTFCIAFYQSSLSTVAAYGISIKVLGSTVAAYGISIKVLGSVGLNHPSTIY
jgi:hypothetical protein